MITPVAKLKMSLAIFFENMVLARSAHSITNVKESQTPLYMIQYGQLQLYLAKHANFGWYIQFSKAGFFNLEIGPKLFFQPTVKTFSSLHFRPPPSPKRGGKTKA
jgi:hypothetical protein